MAQINKPTDYFDGKIYLGSASAVTVTGLNFQPDLVWVKDRDNGNNHCLVDAVRGTGKYISSDLTSAETDNATNSISAFNSDGFTTGTANPANEAASTTKGFMSWNWLASNTTASNTSGSITSTVSANTTSGFSIVSYTGTASSGATIGHGLGVAPKMIIAKNRSIASNWLVYNYSMSANGDYALFLDSTSAKDNTQDYWGDTEPTSSVFTVGSRQEANGSGNNIIAYCFAEKKGFSKFGSYTGNGNADGTFVYTGFKPSYFLLKSSSNAEGWQIYDNQRANAYNPHETYAPTANDSSAEATSSTYGIDFLSNGVKLRGSGSGINGSGYSYIYMAFAENPLVGTNNIPATAR